MAPNLADSQPKHTALVPGAEHVFDRLLDRLPTGIVVVDRKLRIVYINPAARRLLGTDAAIHAGEPLPDPWDQFSIRSVAELLFTRRPEGGRQIVETGDQVLCIEGLYAGGASSATLLLEDVTERERLRQAERRFVENAAHELRTPLAAIVSVVDALESGAKENPAIRDRFLAHIRAHSERLVRLATALLTLARFQTGREQPRLDLVPLEPLLNEVAARITPARGVSVDVEVPDHLAVLTNADLLDHALENVAANAAKHTREGAIVFAARDLGPTVEIELSDTGVGMKRTEVAHAFDRFYRSPARDSEGFGLGLAIADEAVQALGGTIELDSKPGAGTRVRIGLPSARLVS